MSPSMPQAGTRSGHHPRRVPEAWRFVPSAPVLPPATMSTCPTPWIDSLPRRASGSPRPSPRPRRHRSAPGRYSTRATTCSVVAPTGSGKTLAAFLSSIDRLLHAAPPSPDGRKLGTRVLYVSPLKALAVDVERNLRSPLVGITQAGARRGESFHEVTVGVRSGDTPQQERRRLISHPPDILITTPESLFLMLTSSARESLLDVDTVIVDEIHAVAGTKRGTHLALSLERLDGLLEQPARRVGLSATVRPHDEVARFLGGRAPVRIVAPESESLLDPRRHRARRRHDESRRRRIDLAPRRARPPRSPAAGPLHHRVLQLPRARRATDRPSQRGVGRAAGLGRRVRLDPNPGPADGRQRHRPGRRAGSGTGPPRVRQQGAASAHRGRPQVRTPALRGGHLEPGARHRHGRRRSRRADLHSAVGGQRAAARRPCRAPGRRGLARHPLSDVLGTISSALPSRPSACARDSSSSSSCRPTRSTCSRSRRLRQPRSSRSTSRNGSSVVRRSAPFSAVPRSAFDATLDLLAGRYPSDEFAELRPRLVWDRDAGTLTGRPGAQWLAVTSGGTIPDRGHVRRHPRRGSR